MKLSITDKQDLSISARELFALIEPSQTFYGWWYDSSTKYGYEKGIDWEVYPSRLSNLLADHDLNGPTTLDYRISERMALALAHIQYDIRHEKKSPAIEYAYPGADLRELMEESNE
jgi:phage anti-repressor protein